MTLTENVVEMLCLLNEVVNVDFPAADEAGKEHIRSEIEKMLKEWKEDFNEAKKKIEEAGNLASNNSTQGGTK